VSAGCLAILVDLSLAMTAGVEAQVVFVVAVPVLVPVPEQSWAVAAALQESRGLIQRRIRNRLLSSFVICGKRELVIVFIWFGGLVSRDARTLLRVAAFAAAPLDLGPLVRL